MTQEEKARRYDDALERAKEVYHRGYYVSGDIEHIFPELKESEDEKMRKDIISYLQRKQNQGELDAPDWIAWLERQGKETSWKPSKEEMDVLYGLAYITNQYDEHKEEVITRLYQDLKREFFNGSSYENMFPNTEDGVRRRSTIQVLEYARSLDTYNQYGKADINKNIAWLEKQGGKPQGKTALEAINEEIVDNANKVEPKFRVSDTIINIHYKWDGKHRIREIKDDKYIFDSGSYINIKEQDSWELADKVEPKFREGDWVAYNHNPNLPPRKIIQITNEHYIFNNGSFEVKTLEADWHIWSIQDAKDGDVLAESKGDVILMFRGIGNTEWNDVIDYYCYYDCYRKNFILQDGVDYWGDIKNNQLKPATKEQRDLLFSKIKEAGYEWDAEKKELKLLVTNGGDFESTPTDEEVQKLHDHLEMHKQLPKSEPQTITFIDSGTMQVIEKLDEIIGKLGDIHQVLSGPFVFPYRDYTPPQEPWYKTHGVEKVPPVTCETLSGIKGEKSPFNSEEDNEE